MFIPLACFGEGGGVVEWVASPFHSDVSLCVVYSCFFFFFFLNTASSSDCFSCKPSVTGLPNPLCRTDYDHTLNMNIVLSSTVKREKEGPVCISIIFRFFLSV